MYKNVADVPNQAAEEATAIDGNPNGKNDNIIHAVPFEDSRYIPCANGGAGEDVILTGFTNFIYQTSWTDQGFTLVYHDNAHQVTGTGLSSGESFVGSGSINGVIRGSWVDSQWIGTTIGQLRITGQNTSFTITYKYHITVTRDGTVTVQSEAETADCN